MPDTPTFGRYAEIPYEQMTPEQQEGYRFLKEVRGQVGGPSKIWVHDPKLATAARPLDAHSIPASTRFRSASGASPSTSPTANLWPLERRAAQLSCFQR